MKDVKDYAIYYSQCMVCMEQSSGYNNFKRKCVTTVYTYVRQYKE